MRTGLVLLLLLGAGFLTWFLLQDREPPPRSVRDDGPSTTEDLSGEAHLLAETGALVIRVTAPDGTV
ncbi:MAG: hypothetical protein ACC662_10940, partial [Planctomycetota bacterium]